MAHKLQHHRCQPAAAACAVVALLLGCQGADQWTGRSRLPSVVDGQHIEYREYVDPQSPNGPFVLYVIKANASTDVAFLKVMADKGELARDDGRSPDKRAADGDFAGRYDIRKHRNNPDWLLKTRPTDVGEVAKALPQDEEARGEHTHRRYMAGGPSGAFDNAAVCPPHTFLTGIRYRRDKPGKSIAQLAPLCRSEPGAPATSVHGSPWGEDNKSPWESLQCPPGDAVIADAEATLGPWAVYTVLIGLKFKCASLDDDTRKITKVLEAGFPAEGGQRFRCAETDHTTPTPFSRGMRIIAGMRVDAIGMLCDVPREQVTPKTSSMHFESRPSREWTLTMPLRGGVPVEVTSLSRNVAVEGEVLRLPSVVADLSLRPVSTESIAITAVAEGCVVRATDDEVVLLHHPAGRACTVGEDALFTRYRGGKGWKVTRGASVAAGDVLGELPKETALELALAPAHWLGDGVTGENGLPRHVTLAANVPGNVVSLTLPAVAEAAP